MLLISVSIKSCNSDSVKTKAQYNCITICLECICLYLHQLSAQMKKTAHISKEDLVHHLYHNEGLVVKRHKILRLSKINIRDFSLIVFCHGSVTLHTTTTTTTAATTKL